MKTKTSDRVFWTFSRYPGITIFKGDMLIRLPVDGARRAMVTETATSRTRAIGMAVMLHYHADKYILGTKV